MRVPASRSKLSKANSVALEPDRGALPVTTRKFDTFNSEIGSDGIRNEVKPIQTPRTTTTVVRNEKTPFSLCIVVCIFFDRSCGSFAKSLRENVARAESESAKMWPANPSDAQNAPRRSSPHRE